MDLTPMHKRVIALDVHQAKITACAVVEHDDGRVEVIKRDFGAFATSAQRATVRVSRLSARAVCATVSCWRTRWSRIWQ